MATILEKPFDVDLSALATAGDAMFAPLNTLREADPIHWSETSHCWIISGHSQVLEGFRGRLPLSNHQFPAALYRIVPPGDFEARFPNAARFMDPIVTNSDGPDHTRRRKLMVQAVNRKLVESLRPFVQARVAHLLDWAEGRDEIEFNEQIARMLPGAVILKLIGLDPDIYLARLKGWADAVTQGLASFNPRIEWLDGLETAVTDMVAVFRAAIEEHRAEPRDDLISALLNSVEDEQRLTMDEMIGALILVIVAGHDTTANTMTLGIRAMAKHPDAWAYWRDHPDQGLACTNELMRYVAMSTTLPRIVTEDFEWEGRQLMAGQLVMLMIASGNRDPRANADPERLDFTRPNDMALTFGPGLHHCIGHLLAKLQLGEFFGALTQRFAGAELLAEPDFTNALVFRGVTALRVRLNN